jgi:hypothetical protein
MPPHRRPYGFLIPQTMNPTAQAAAVLSGSRDETTTFTERWTLSLDGSDSSAWRIAAVDGGLDRTAR